ncbi:MAG: hypothetical protein F4Y60_03955 [Boseongicola sp. SB0664_bin_43]|uniref:Uncharacterized protein n=1 Tax=Boseongicola sp. SB0664_bin_43 TaxID=2604844 RepID=A0A6B0XZK7_9RHOB|nr:hypothetical protein [Boseongicola sp. SB0664_bin_43]
MLRSSQFRCLTWKLSPKWRREVEFLSSAGTQAADSLVAIVANGNESPAQAAISKKASTQGTAWEFGWTRGNLPLEFLQMFLKPFHEMQDLDAVLFLLADPKRDVSADLGKVRLDSPRAAEVTKQADEPFRQCDQGISRSQQVQWDH